MTSARFYRPRPSALATLALIGVAALGCGGSSFAGGSEGKLTLVAYSTPKEAYEEIIPAFNATRAGEGIGFDQSYGSSGEQARAVEGGLEADLVALSLEPDVAQLVDAGLVEESWNQDRFEGFVTNSVVVFAVREGNPKGIRSWDDLVSGDVEVITPNPFTSGGAKWNIMAAYGAQIEQGKSEEEALDYVRRLFENVPVQDKSARESLQTFSGGKGDVLLAYENEAITARQKGEELDYVLPDETILIENPIAAVTDGNVEQASRFIEFARSREAQEVFAEKGYRSVLEHVLDEDDYPEPPGLFDIDAFGGWDAVNDEFFDTEDGTVTKILQDLGVSTESG